jgi:hypothetical protein
MGKPKKSQTPQVTTVVKTVQEVLGKKALYIGVLGARFHCKTCGRTYKKGMILEYQNNRYCSETCIRKDTAST